MTGATDAEVAAPMPDDDVLRSRQRLPIRGRLLRASRMTVGLRISIVSEMSCTTRSEIHSATYLVVDF